MNDPDPRGWMHANRAWWDEHATIHLRDASGFYGVDRFRAGQDPLLDIVSDEIGDVRGKRIAHLQCHIGIDALCLARRGAIVTGLDYSAAAITAAQSLATENNLSATFVCGNVYDAPQLLAGKFDIVYVSWGSLNWLPDIWDWADVVGALLAPGGYLYLVEQHPSFATLKEFDGQLHPFYSWRTPIDRPVVTEVESTYSGEQQRLEYTRRHEWEHPLSDIIGAITEAGLWLAYLREHEVLPWKRFSMMVPARIGFFCMPEDRATLPLSFSLKAFKS
jgi:SAM-dependent methyltransferase